MTPEKTLEPSFKFRVTLPQGFAWFAVAIPFFCSAAGNGLSPRGYTGGLVIPNADVLEVGSLGASFSSYQEPELGQFSKRQNYSLGVGLFSRMELFGRFAEFQNPVDGARFFSGPRDLSANIKVQFVPFGVEQPKLALGVTDIGGGAAFFKSRYVVAGDTFGLVGWTIGYAKGSPILGDAKSGTAFDGVFAGVELKLPQSGFSILGEHEGQRTHAGIRYSSSPVPFLANARVVGSIHRSAGTKTNGGNNVSLNVILPLGKSDEKDLTFEPKHRLLPTLDAITSTSGPLPTDLDQQESLLRALVAAGLERVRVGVVSDDLVIEYENHLYDHNEADAIGIVLGMGVESAPRGSRRVRAIVKKSGLPIYQISVGVAEFRNFLRDGETHFVSSSLAVDRLREYEGNQIQWVSTSSSSYSRLRVEVKPDLSYTLGTEVAAFDYTLAANVQAFAPLWRGAELYSSIIHRLSNSENFEPAAVFSSSRQRNGLKVMAVQQSFQVGEYVLANVGIGTYNWGAAGLQAEATAFVPGREDVARVKAGFFVGHRGETQPRAASASYRWVYSSNTWLEAGLQQYSDGSRGPSVVLTRWFADVAVNLFYRKGGVRQFAGLELSIPLTSRKALALRGITFAGSSEFTAGVRSRITDGSTGFNAVSTSSVRDFQLDYSQETRHLNRGRSSEKYFVSQLSRMREAFYVYGRDLLPK